MKKNTRTKIAKKSLLFDWPNVLNRIQTDKSIGAYIFLYMGVLMLIFSVASYSATQYCWKYETYKTGEIIEKRIETSKGANTYKIKIKYPIQADYNSNYTSAISKDMYDSLKISNIIRFKTLDFIEDLTVVDPRNANNGIKSGIIGILLIMIGAFEMRKKIRKATN